MIRLKMSILLVTFCQHHTINETQLLQQSTTICLYRSIHADLSVFIISYHAVLVTGPPKSCSTLRTYNNHFLSFLLLSRSCIIQKIEAAAAAGSSVTKTYCFALTMERLFSPCTRYREMVESQGDLGEFNGSFELLQELNLNVSTEEFLSAERAFTYVDLYAMLRNGYSILWLTPHAAVVRERANEIHPCRFGFSADRRDILAFARSPDHLLEICDVVLRLLAASVVHSVTLGSWFRSDGALINAPTLAYLLERCRSLKVLRLQAFESLDENQIRVLGAYSRPGLEIELHSCGITSAGASALVEVLGRNQGPTKLFLCDVDTFVLADGLRGNSRLKILNLPLLNNRGVGNRQVLAIAGALRENKGLVDLNLMHDFTMSDEAWGAVCDSLKTHPTLEVLDLRSTWGDLLAPAVITSPIQALLDMMKVNMSIHTIRLNSKYSQNELFRGSVIPYLETNRFRPRLLAIQTTHPITYRSKVLGRALLSVGADANRFWMLLSGNADVAFPSRTTTIAAAAPVTASATDTGTSTANVVAGASSMMSTLTITATGRLPAAAAATTAVNVATPSAGQKRKACP
jgi:hypothetical protein